MSAAGAPWAQSGPPFVIVSDDGRRATIQVCEHGIEYTDDGGKTVLVHVEEDPNDPTRLKIGALWFRAEGA